MQVLEIVSFSLGIFIILFYLLIVLANPHIFKKARNRGRVTRKICKYSLFFITVSFILNMYRYNKSMKVLEIIFLILGISILTVFLLLILANKSKRKFKITRKALTSFIFCLLAFIGFKSYNNSLSIKYNGEENIEESVSQTIKEEELPEYITPIPNNELTRNGFKIEVIDGVTYIDGILIVNKTYSLPSNYIPENTHETVTENTTYCPNCINEEAYQAFTKMQQDMATAEHNIWVASGYRSYSYQNELYNSYVKSSSIVEADTYSARAGHSEHQTGYGFDVCSNDYPNACINSNFEGTPPAEWLKNNSYKYGFIIRYPKGKENITGYKYEPWHLRYVGIDLATKLYNSNLTLEEYFGIDSTYSY